MQVVSGNDLELALDRVRADAAGPVAGVFGPSSVTWRIDRDLLDHFQADGPGWQDRINAALRKAAGK